MGINDIGGVGAPLNAPKLGGPDGWAVAVRDELVRLAGLIGATAGWQSFTPTVSGVALQSSVCRYTRTGDTVHASYHLVTSAAPTGEVTATLPVEAAGAIGTGNVHALARLIVASSSYAGAVFFGGSTSVLIRYIGDAGPNTYLAITPTKPAAWASGATISFNLTYEASAAALLPADGEA